MEALLRLPESYIYKSTNYSTYSLWLSHLAASNQGKRDGPVKACDETVCRPLTEVCKTRLVATVGMEFEVPHMPRTKDPKPQWMVVHRPIVQIGSKRSASQGHCTGSNYNGVFPFKSPRIERMLVLPLTPAKSLFSKLVSANSSSKARSSRL